MISYLVQASVQYESDLLARVQPFLSDEKRNRIARSRNVQDRVCMAAGELLVAYGLREFCGHTYRGEEIKTTPQGKPYLSSLEGVHFNISHSRECVLVGVDAEPVGVDIQYHTIVREEVARKIMPDDIFHSWKLSGCQVDFFFDYWAEKESVLKWQGVGISGLRQNEWSLPAGVSVSKLSAPEGYSACVCSSSEVTLKPVSIHNLFNTLW